MNINDLFRSLFGLKHAEDFDNHDNPYRDDSNDSHDDEHEEEILPGFSFTGIGNMDDMFRHFHGDMERQMEEMQRQMEDMFKNFGRTDFPALPPSPSVPHDIQPDNRDSSRSSNLRDRMLKEPANEADHRSPDHQPGPPHKGFSFFDVLPAVPHWNKPPAQEKLDSDLDETVKQADDLSKLFDSSEGRRSGPPTIVPRPDQSESSFRSVSISTIRRPDGSVEHKRTTRDSSGNEESTVTRSLGDQTHTETTRTDATGEQHHQQKYTNIDEKDKAWFEKAWRNPSSSSLPSSDKQLHEAFLKEQTSLPSTQQEDTTINKSMFQKFFGFSWPSTSRKDL